MPIRVCFKVSCSYKLMQQSKCEVCVAVFEMGGVNHVIPPIHDGLR